MRQYINSLCLILIFFCLATVPVTAQSIIPTPNIDLSSSVQNPSPGQTLTISAKSFNADLNSSTLVWYINGTEVKRGIGAVNLETKAPESGKVSNVTLTAISLNGSRLNGSLSLSSGSVDLIIESDGYVPALFLGKNRPVYENKIKIIAIPHLTQKNGVEYDPDTLIYEWTRNESVIQNQSGYGKSSIILDGSLIPRTFTVTVNVHSRNNDAYVNGIVSIAPEQAVLTMYIDDPLYGPLFNKAITDQIDLGNEKESAVVAIPYGFNAINTDNVSYDWMINDNLRQDLLKNQSIILRAPSGGTGTSVVSLKIKNIRNILQSASGGFNVSFSSLKGNNSSQTSF